jgi:excisionase family DNA binding protein
VTTANTSRLLELGDVCAELHLGRTKLHELINAGQLTRVRIGTRAYITRESLDAFIDGLPVG